MNRQIITALVIIALLAVVGVLHYMAQMDPVQLAERGVGRDAHDHGDHDDEGPPPLSRDDADYVLPIGPENAPVEILVCYDNVQLVRDEYRELMEQMGRDYSPHLRVEFVDSSDEANREMIDAISEGFTIGLIINGEVVKHVPEAAFGMVAFSGSPMLEEWSVPELKMAIEHDLRTKGVEFTSHVGEQPQPQQPGPGHEHDRE